MKIGRIEKWAMNGWDRFVCVTAWAETTVIPIFYVTLGGFASVIQSWLIRLVEKAVVLPLKNKLELCFLESCTILKDNMIITEIILSTSSDTIQSHVSTRLSE